MPDDPSPPPAPEPPSAFADAPERRVVVAPERWRQRAPLVVTEAVGGDAWRATFRDGTLHVEVAPTGSFAWARAARFAPPPAVALWLRDHPGHVTFGATGGATGARCEDVWGPHGWLAWEDLVASRLPLPRVLGTAVWRGDLAALGSWATDHLEEAVSGVLFRPALHDHASRIAPERPFWCASGV